MEPYLEKLQEIISKVTNPSDTSLLTPTEIVYINARRGYLTPGQKKLLSSVLQTVEEPKSEVTEEPEADKPQVQEPTQYTDVTPAQEQVTQPQEQPEQEAAQPQPEAEVDPYDPDATTPAVDPYDPDAR